VGRALFSTPPLTVCLVLCCCLFALVARGGPRDEPGRLLVFVEVPSETPPATILDLAGIEAVGNGSAVRQVTLRHQQLDARALMGRQVLLAEMELPAGSYHVLKLHLDGVRTAVGTAPVVPGVDPAGYAVTVDMELAAGACEAVFLRWLPARESGRDQPYVPRLEVRLEPLPPLGSLALVTRRDPGMLVAVDRMAGRVVHVQRLGEDPRDVVYLPLRQKIFVALADQDALVEVDALSLRQERVIPLQFGDEPSRLALAPDGGTLHVLNVGSRSLATLNVWSLQERSRVAVGEGPRDMDVDIRSGQVYVACEDEGQVQVVDPDQGRIVATHSAVSSPVAVVFDSDLRRLYVASASQYRLFGFDLMEGADLGSQSLCGSAVDLVFEPRAHQVFAAVPGCRQVAVLRPAAGVEFAPLKLSHSPQRLAFDAEYSQFLATAPGAGIVVIGDPHSGRTLASVEVGGTPTAVVVP